MKQVVLLYSFVMFFMIGLMDAQVGINTENPQGILHIDGHSSTATTNPDNGVPSALQQSDDVIIGTEGNVGIGLIDPNAKLDIKSTEVSKGFKLSDGSEKDNFVLTSDEDGFGNWQPIDITMFEIDLKNFSEFSLQDGGNTVYYTGCYITLPPGHWLINFTLGIEMTPSTTYQAGSNFIRLRFLDTPTPTNTSYLPNNISSDSTSPTLASSGFPLSMERGTYTGSLSLNNTSELYKTYYLFADQGASSSNGQTKFSLKFNWNESHANYFRVRTSNNKN